MTQRLLDTANYTYEKKNGSGIVHDVRNELSGYFAKKKVAAEKLAAKVSKLYDQDYNDSVPSNSRLDQLSQSVYLDSDVPATWSKEIFEFDS